MSYKNPEGKRKEVIEFLKKNPTATYRKLKEAGYIHIERLFKNGLKEAYKEAGVEPPRTFETKTKKEKRKIIIEYIKKHPNAGGQDIKKDTKINFQALFKDTPTAFRAANIFYPREEKVRLRKRSKEEKISEIIKLVKKNPETTFEEIANKLRINPYKMFKNFNEIYKIAGMNMISGTHKRALKKKIAVIEFIKNNPLATQREINLNCKTRIQGMFEKGIFGAYKEAGVEFPFERLKLHGSAINEIKQRAKDFEEKIARKLSCYGNVNRLVKTKRGVADIILERNNKKVIIEVKDYLSKEISNHEIKQLNKYLEDCNCNLGLLICHEKPKKDSFLIDENRLIILDESELRKIPKIIDSR